MTRRKRQWLYLRDDADAPTCLRGLSPPLVIKWLASLPARLHTECAGWNEKDPLKRFTDEHRMKVLDEVVDRGVHICTKQGSDEVIRAVSRRRRLLGLP